VPAIHDYSQTTHKIKMPYKMLQGVRKKQKERAVKAAEMLKQSGVVTGKRSTLSQIQKSQEAKRGKKRART
jgi:hypothetical protein